ncbi:MAG TPA: aspartate aminotransferase family protein [Solirubrobacteraceae bacterium]|nr:aspartate aminotransferase family protein [Solirubrobacteraceae bacterium]
MTISVDTPGVRAARERYVSSAVSTPPLVVVGAQGARIEADDGRTYIDFAGGIGCQNLGHGHPAVVAAIHEQVDRYLHQCFMVGTYEPYVDVCRRLAELYPGAGADYKSVLVNSGAEAVENAIKIARAATGRPAVIAFDRAFHGRTLLTMSITSKVTPYKRGFGPFAPEVYRAPAPYPFRHIDSDAAIAGLRELFKAEVDPETVACVVLEPVQGEGGFIPMPADFPRRLREECAAHGILYVDDEVQSGVGRTGPVWAIEHYDVEPDLLVSGKSLGGGLPLAAVTGRAELMDAVPAGGLGGTFGGNPVACAAAAAVLDAVATPDYLARADVLGATIRARLDALAQQLACMGDVRGLGPMVAVELVEDDEGMTPAPERAAAVVAAARERGLLLLTCGLYGNVVRLLPPITIAPDDLAQGLDTLEGALRAAGA